MNRDENRHKKANVETFCDESKDREECASGHAWCGPEEIVECGIFKADTDGVRCHGHLMLQRGQDGRETSIDGWMCWVKGNFV